MLSSSSCLSVPRRLCELEITVAGQHCITRYEQSHLNLTSLFCVLLCSFVFVFFCFVQCLFSGIAVNGICASCCAYQAWAGRVRTIELLLQLAREGAGAKVASYGPSIAANATKKAQKSFSDFLNGKDRWSRTALSWAVFRNQSVSVVGCRFQNDARPV